MDVISLLVSDDVNDYGSIYFAGNRRNIYHPLTFIGFAAL